MSVVQRAMVWLGITDDEEEIEMPVYAHRSHEEWHEEPRREPVPDQRTYEPRGSYDRQDRGAQPLFEQRVAGNSPRVQVVAPPEPRYEPLRFEEPTRVMSTPPRERPSYETPSSEPAPASQAGVIRPFRSERTDAPKLHLAVPSKFYDVQEIADYFKSGRPVIVNLEGVDKELHRRVIDFSSGLAYALGGKMKKVAEQVFLITPQKVEVDESQIEMITERASSRGL